MEENLTGMSHWESHGERVENALRMPGEAEEEDNDGRRWLVARLYILLTGE